MEGGNGMLDQSTQLPESAHSADSRILLLTIWVHRFKRSFFYIFNSVSCEVSQRKAMISTFAIIHVAHHEVVKVPFLLNEYVQCVSSPVLAPSTYNTARPQYRGAHKLDLLIE